VAQQHLDRLTSVDASFLHLEDAGHAHMQIGGLAVLDGPPPTEEELFDHLSSRVHFVPRYRQRLAHPPLRTGRPVWVDDPSFRLTYHVRRTALPPPGSEEQLLRLVARVMSQRLDRAKPLWELWVVEGLAGDAFGLLSKNHHALVDGVGGVDLLTTMFDLAPEGVQVDPPPWSPRPAPSPLGLLAHGTVGGLRALTGAAVGVTGAVLRRPVETAGEIVERAQGLGEVARAFLRPAATTPLNVPPGPHRRFAVVRARLEDFRTVKNTFGGTVNDVVLAVVSGALGRYLRGRGISTEGSRLRAMVPMSIRREDQRHAAGNRLAAMVVPLAVDETDPVTRLARTRAAMDALKTSKQPVGARTLTDVESWLPPTLLAQASRLNLSSRLYNVLITNVPGPQFPVYLLGRRLREAFPVAFLAPDHTLAVAVLSYAGTMAFGLVGDYDVVPDLDVLATEIEAGVRELLVCAREASPAGRRDG
jgi:diacylglycerol O-acyltransferase